MNKNIETVQTLLSLAESSDADIAEIKLTDEDGRQVHIKFKQESPAMAVPMATQTAVHMPPPPATPTASSAADTDQTATPPTTKGTPLLAPMVGTVYLAPSPGAEPFLKVGQFVKKGDTICLIEAMKMFNKVEAEHDGKVVECLVKNAQAIEFDQALFIIDTDDDHQ